MMTIVITPLSVDWNPASRLIKKEDSTAEKYRLLDKFSKYMADVLVKELVRAIDTQRYRSLWHPLKKEYLEFKIEKGLSTNIWEATGLLKKSIKSYRSGNKWYVGISRKLVYPGTSTRIYDVARRIEYGTDKVPPRPLFRPILTYLSKNIRRYWLKFLSQVGNY